jgi:hypothetical protein
MNPSQDMLFANKNRYIPTKSGEQGGGRNPTSVTPLNDQAGSLARRAWNERKDIIAHDSLCIKLRDPSITLILRDKRKRDPQRKNGEPDGENNQRFQKTRHALKEAQNTSDMHCPIRLAFDGRVCLGNVRRGVETSGSRHPI